MLQVQKKRPLGKQMPHKAMKKSELEERENAGARRSTVVCLLALGLENHNYWNFDSSFYLTEGPEPVAGLVLFYPRGDSPAGLFQVFGPFQML